MARREVNTVITQMVECSRSGRKHPVTIGFGNVLEVDENSKTRTKRDTVMFIRSKCSHGHADDAIARLGGGVCSARAQVIKEVLNGKIESSKYSSRKVKIEPALPERVGEIAYASRSLRETRQREAEKSKAPTTPLLGRLLTKAATRFGILEMSVIALNDTITLSAGNGYSDPMLEVAIRSGGRWLTGAYPGDRERSTFAYRRIDGVMKNVCLVCHKAYERYGKTSTHCKSKQHRKAFEEAKQKLVLWLHKARVTGLRLLEGGGK